MRDTLAKATPSGYLFRVDLRLRPEGRFGPVSRSLSSCRAYYESWAEPWERQALIKARAIAGDEGLGAAFVQMTQSFVYQTRLEEPFVESIRQNKRRLEQKVERAGEAEVNVKEGLGGIRDIEFTVQLMLLLAGGAHPTVRTGNTLAALDRLTEIGMLSVEECAAFREAYVFLRTVEHRLQLLDDRAIRCLPRGPGALQKFGRVLGYPDGPTFSREYHRQTQRVHRLFEGLFYRGTVGKEPQTGLFAQWILALDDAGSQERVREALRERGFADAAAAQSLLRLPVAESTYGAIPPEARAGFAAIAEPLIDAAARTSRPDDALRGLVFLAQAVPSAAALYQMLGENHDLLPRLCRLAGDAGAIWQLLLSHLEFFDLLADSEAMDHPLTPPTATLTPPTLARYALRTRLHAGARDVWELTDVVGTAAEITHAAETILQQTIAIARDQLGVDAPFAVIGLGKLGGAELGYGSDWDVLYVGGEDLAGATLLAERVQRLLREELARQGVRFEIDARLRPEGQKGALVLDLASYQDYYAHRAATWERQALTKARWVAGDASLGRQFIADAQSFVYAGPASAAEVDEIRAMKRRLEAERSQGPHDIKLGPGGLSDVEWTAQLLQLQHGHRRRPLRVPGTLAALKALRDDAFITQSDWEGLDRAYRLLTRLRNHHYLRTGVGSDIAADLSETVRAAMREARAICRRRFYGESDDADAAAGI